MSEEIGFVGLGRMGSRMAARLLSAGHSLTVFDIDDAAVAALPKRGAKAARSPKEVALGGRGLVNGSRIRTFVDLSTSGPRVAAAVAGALSPKGIAALDAPVS